MEFSKHNWARISETICPEMLIYLQVGLLHIVLSEYPDKSHDFKNFIFTTSHFSSLYRCLQAENNGLEILFYNFKKIKYFPWLLSTHDLNN